MRRGQRQVGLGEEPAKEFAYAPGQRVLIDSELYPLEGVITDVRTDPAGRKIIYVVPWGGEARPFLYDDLIPVQEATAASSTIRRYMWAVLTGSLP